MAKNNLKNSFKKKSLLSVSLEIGCKPPIAGNETKRVEEQTICLGKKSSIAYEQPWEIKFYFTASVERRDHTPKYH